MWPKKGRGQLEECQQRWAAGPGSAGSTEVGLWWRGPPRAPLEDICLLGEGHSLAQLCHASALSPHRDRKGPQGNRGNREKPGCLDCLEWM